MKQKSSAHFLPRSALATTGSLDNASPAIHSGRMPDLPAAFQNVPLLPQPLAFDGIAGWLHAARGRRGVVICNTLGYEALCCQPALRALGDALARAGLPALRFDYPSEGDSLGVSGDPDRLAAWIDSALRAVDHLASLGEIEEIAMVGLGFGAFAALEAAARRSCVRSLVLLAPPASGKALARQMRADAAMAAAELNQPVQAEDGGLCIAGFEFSAATLADLSKLTPNFSRLPARLLALSPHGAAPRGFEALKGLATQKFSGHALMLAARVLPHVPDGDWARVVDFLSADAPAPARTPLLAPVSGATQSGDGFAEAFGRFGAGGDLAGVFCAPAQGWGDSCVIFVNTGANSHIGWARGAVTLARKLARDAGIASLRMDLRGIGESAGLPGGARAALYDVARTADIREAVAFAKSRGYRRITLVGQCSGAYAALQAALRDEGVNGLVLVNLLRFTWGEGETIEQAMARYDRSTDGYIDMMRTGDALRRIARGDLPLRGVLRAAQKFSRRGALALGEAAAELAGAAPKPDTPEAWLHQLSARGVSMCFLFSETDNGLDEFAKFFGRGDWRVRRIAGLQKVIVQDADHNLSSRAAREVLFEQVRAAAR